MIERYELLFNDVIDATVREINRFIDDVEHGDRSHLARVVWIVVRDVRGRVRVAVDDEREYEEDGRTFKVSKVTREEQAELDKVLEGALENWFHGPVVVATQGRESLGLVKRLDELSKDLPERVPGRRFQLVDRLQSKHAWLSTSGAVPEPPWPLVAESPPLVAFFSFKGGVGRTTTLGLLAEQLALRGKKILCLDLDLEAPGLGDFMGVSSTGPGVLDAVLAHAVTGKLPDMTGWWLDAKRSSALVDGKEVGNIKVLPAGALGHHYIEKLGRLDFQSVSNVAAQSPVELALRALFKAAKEEHKPDYILIDSRAGLNEVGGVLLNHLSHVQFLVARNTKQNIEGMKTILIGLAQFKPLAGRARLVQTFVDPTKEAEQREEFQRELWEAFYMGADDGDTVPVDAAGPHEPLAIPTDEVFTQFGTLYEVWSELRKSFEPRLKALEDALGALVTEKVQA